MMRITVVLLSALAVPLAACPGKGASEPAPSPRSPIAQEMIDHAAHGAAMRDGVARADLELARREARILADLRVERSDEPLWREKLAGMKAAVARVAEAPDLAAASRALAGVARTCGECHAMLVRPAVVVGAPPAEELAVVASMKRHQWAAVRLWYGLIFPSSGAWSAGARALIEAPLAPGPLTPGKAPDPEIGELERSAHALGRRAEAATSAADREMVYGELMSTCSACHSWFGGGPLAAPMDGGVKSR